MINETNQSTNAGHSATEKPAQKGNLCAWLGVMRGMNGRRMVSCLMRLVRLTQHWWKEYHRDAWEETMAIRRLKGYATDLYNKGQLALARGDKDEFRRCCFLHDAVSTELEEMLTSYEKRFLRKK